VEPVCWGDSPSSGSGVQQYLLNPGTYNSGLSSGGEPTGLFGGVAAQPLTWTVTASNTTPSASYMANAVLNNP